MEVVPAEKFLDDAPFGADLIVNVVHFLKLPLLPLVLVEFWIYEVYPPFSDLYLSALKAFFFEAFANLLPFF